MGSRHTFLSGSVIVGLLFVGTPLTQAQMDPVFTYQGLLEAQGAPLTDTVDIRFSLWDDPTTGTQIGTSFMPLSGVDVVNGLFTVEVDAMAFGPAAFDGNPRWLEIEVHDGIGWVALSPRQPIMPAPYALYALDGAGGGGSLWGTSANDIYYTAGNVGIGEPYPWAPLTIVSPGSIEAVAVQNPVDNTTATLAGTGAGVSGATDNPDGAGVYGSNSSFGPGLCIGVWGHASKPGGYAGFFDGRGYFADEVGIGRTPTAKLDVAGTVRTDGFQLTDSPVSGYVLTTDETGIGTWQPGGGGSVWSVDAEGINYQAGNVGIGCPSDPSWPLMVDTSAAQAIHVHNSNAAAQSFALYAEADSTLARTVFGDATATSGQTVGVFGRTNSPDGYGLFGDAQSSTGSAIGVYGRSDAANGYGGYFKTNSINGYGVYAEAMSAASGYAGYFVGRGYFSNNVGIGTAQPNSPLTVMGVIESSTGGFMFPDGTIQTTAGSGGASIWQQNGNEIYYDVDNVGIGVSDPQATLHLVGGQWDVAATEGDFKIGDSTYRLKMGVATSGGGAGECRIFAGGPSSELILGANGQDRLAVTGTEVNITGTLEVDGFRLADSTTSGYVLTCDSAGNGTWQPGGGGGFSLPYSDTITSSGTAFSITNSGDGPGTRAIKATIDGASSADACAGEFRTNGCSGYAIYAASDSSTTVRANHQGSVGTAFYGTSSGNGGALFTCSEVDGYGVKGQANATSGSDTVGGWFESDSLLGKGVYGMATGTYATGVKAEASGNDATGMSAIATGSNGIALSAKNESSTQPALLVKNYVGGPLIRARNTAANTVFEVTNDGTTHVSVLQITGGADLAEKFDVTEEDAQPGMVVEIDPDNPGKLCIARGAYNRRVAGVISGANELGVGMVLADLPGSENAMPIALSGRVWVHCTATQQAIEPGDLLTTADLPGHAMAVTEHGRAHGAVIGKAMSRLAKGETDMVLVLVNLQ